MSKRKPDVLERSQLLQKALSRWNNEGGAEPGHPGLASSKGLSDAPPLTNAELVQLQIRVIALENLVISLISGASDQQLDIARAMATYIAPRPGYTPHPLTIHAAARIVHLVERGDHFRAAPKL